VEAVRSYFSLVPSNLDAGWARLAPGMQAKVGRGSYDGFWGSIQAVQASDITPLSGRPATDVTLTYHFTDGRVVVERQRLDLQPSPSGYLIADDQVLSSRTVNG
jgi:eukaryotic-like serine/threonine-protein kinase